MAAPGNKPLSGGGLGRVSGPFRLDRTSLTYAEEAVPQREGKTNWRRWTVRFLHSTSVHRVATALLVLDLLLVVASMELQVQSRIFEGNAKQQCLDAYATASAVPEPFIGNPQCNPAGAPDCDVKAQAPYRVAHALHEAELVLAACSMAILSVFLLENLAMLAAIGLQFFHSFFFVLDILVVSISLALESWAISAPNKETLLALGLIVTARIWRFFRVAHGVYFLEHARGSDAGNLEGGASPSGEARDSAGRA
uniref:Voltage-gated hydrogen channel 1 n=1 Tax=Tetraselmis sp. GSL018 TaxID=582737 RepID=A0A061R0T5_9CHLO|mmetsp:Transcript_33177/g.78690  ORF Transcript_33177/g.78690 Transcript_33177/m.78690 type:complete len:253 (+) Transcript_33177:481-1239(+)